MIHLLMDKITLTVIVLGIVAAAFGVMATIRTGKIRGQWATAAGVAVVGAVGVWVMGMVVQEPEKSAPTVQQGDCSSAGKVGGDFSPNCNNSKN
jgi:hypothetical protein